MLKSVPLIVVLPESSMVFLTNWNSKPEVSKPMPVLSLPPLIGWLSKALWKPIFKKEAFKKEAS